MNLLENLATTYDNSADAVGLADDGNPLLPLCHTTQNVQIEIALDAAGRFRRAHLLERGSEKTIIPCTESSGGRAGSKPTAHPLCDKLQYVARDFLAFGGSVTSGFAKNPKEPHDTYCKLLSDWCQSPFRHPKVAAVLEYVSRGTVVSDLIAHGLLPVDSSGSRLTGDLSTLPDATAEKFARLLPAGGSPQDAFVRWTVEVSGDQDSCLWLDPSAWESWASFYAARDAIHGLCYITGKVSALALQHPAKIRNSGDKAKLISANDGSGFTFRGRFTDSDGTQACGVSFETTQKAHNALRWLIARQGRRDGSQAIVAWALNGKALPRLDYDTHEALKETSADDFEALDDPDAATSGGSAELAQAFALRLKQKIGGYRAELGDSTGIVILGLDSATPGRMAITFYRELTASDFLARLERWHRECAWWQNFGSGKRFVGAPSPRDIAETAFGRRLNDKLLAATFRRILPCIIDSIPIPRDLVTNCVRRASSRHGIDHGEWEKALGIACSLYRKSQFDLHHKDPPMALQRTHTHRDYLYGRLLAVADHLESGAIKAAGEKRESAAGRLMQRFADRPFSTWRTIELALVPYIQRLRGNSPGLLAMYENEQREIMDLFDAESFARDEPLTGEFLLAFHSQRSALWQKKPKFESPENSDASDA